MNRITRPSDLPDDIKTAFIGGTGVYTLPDMKILAKYNPETPWGFASSPVTVAELYGNKIAFIARHGEAHSILPSEIPVRANIALLKWMGVERIISFSAVGSLKEEIAPKDFILPSSIIDRTYKREQSFFGEGVVAHCSFGDPFCPSLSFFIENIFKEDFPGLKLHTKESMICMEGPAFSTRAESLIYKSWGAGIINMSVLPEAKLAREAEICYQMICMATDYDSWRESEESVKTEDIMAVLSENSRNAANIILAILSKLNEYGKTKNTCSCRTNMKYSIMTAPDKQKAETRIKLKEILPEYFQ